MKAVICGSYSEDKCRLEGNLYDVQHHLFRHCLPLFWVWFVEILLSLDAHIHLPILNLLAEIKSRGADDEQTRSLFSTADMSPFTLHTGALVPLK